MGQEGEDTWKSLLTQGGHAAANNQYAEAEQNYLKALHEAERWGPGDWRVGVTLEGLGRTFHAERKLSDAENAFRRAAGITEKVDGDESVEAANVNYEIGSVLLDAGHPVDAVLYGRRALMIYEAKRGGASRESANALCLMGDSLRAMRNFIDAEEPLRRCADIRESDGGIDNLEFAGLCTALR